MKLSIVFWNNHPESCINDLLEDDILQSVAVYEAKDFSQVLMLLEKHPTIEMLLTTLHPTDLQTLCSFQQLQQQHPDIALVAIIDTILRVPNVISTMRRFVTGNNPTETSIAAESNAALVADKSAEAPSLADVVPPEEDDSDTLFDINNPFRTDHVAYKTEVTNLSNGVQSNSNNAINVSSPTQNSTATPYRMDVQYDTAPASPHPYMSGYEGGPFDPRCHLTPRQVDVLYLLMRGKSNKEIARILDLSEGTVKIHCMAIFRELGVNNRTQAAMRAEQLMPKLQSHWAKSAANFGAI